MSNISISVLRSDQTAAAACIFARAFVTSPLNAAAFGTAALSANEAFFRSGLAVMKGTKLVAIENSRIVGAIHWANSPGCQLSGVEKLRAIPAMVKAFGLGSAIKVISWLSAWSKHDPCEPHAHLGPIAVDPGDQGRHIGHKLMDCYCGEIDRTCAVGYLETDRPENVGFYKRFGFEVMATMSILGVINYFMRRPVSHFTTS